MGIVTRSFRIKYFLTRKKKEDASLVGLVRDDYIIFAETELLLSLRAIDLFRAESFIVALSNRFASSSSSRFFYIRTLGKVRIPVD